MFMLEERGYNYWLERVKQNERALQFVPQEHKTYELCLEAVKQDGRVLQYTLAKHQTYELCLEAVKQNGWALEFVPEKYKTYEFCLEAVKRRGYALEYVPQEHQTKELQLTALNQNLNAINYINVVTLPISEWNIEWFKYLNNVELKRQFIRERGFEVIDQLNCRTVTETKEYKLVKYKVVKNQEDFNKALIFKCPSSGDTYFSEVPNTCKTLKEALKFLNNGVEQFACES